MVLSWIGLVGLRWLDDDGRIMRKASAISVPKPVGLTNLYRDLPGVPTIVTRQRLLITEMLQANQKARWLERFDHSLSVITPCARIVLSYCLHSDGSPAAAAAQHRAFAVHARAARPGDMNGISTGIEIDNAGWVDGPNGRTWTFYPDRRIDTLISLVKDVKGRRHIAPAPVRAQDAEAAAFDAAAPKAMCGMSGLGTRDTF